MNIKIALGFILLSTVLLLAPTASADNEIVIEQTGGDNLNLTIEQFGGNNVINMYDSSSYINGSDLTLTLVQQNETTTNNVIDLWHLDGTDNIVRWGQGVAWDNATSTSHSYDSDEGGGHYARIDIHGNNNHLQGHQTNQGSTSGHTFNSLIFSSDNDIWVRQQHDGAKTINLTTYNSSNDVSLRQKGNGGAHSATITLDGTYGTTLNLLQQGTTTQSYSIYQNCVTAGGCSVSVTQEQ